MFRIICQNYFSMLHVKVERLMCETLCVCVCRKCLINFMFLFRLIAITDFLKKNHSLPIPFIVNKLILRNILPENYKPLQEKA